MPVSREASVSHRGTFRRRVSAASGIRERPRDSRRRQAPAECGFRPACGSSRVLRTVTTSACRCTMASVRVLSLGSHSMRPPPAALSGKNDELTNRAIPHEPASPTLPSQAERPPPVQSLGRQGRQARRSRINLECLRSISGRPLRVCFFAEYLSKYS